MNISSCKKALQAMGDLLGKDNILTREEAYGSYGKTTFDAPYSVLGVVIVSNKDHIPELVKIANKYKTPLYPISAGKNWGYGNALPPQEAIVLDLSGLKKISHFDKELGIITLEPGVTHGELHEFLKKNNAPFLVPVHGGGPTCSIVGNALERGYGITPITDHFTSVMSLTAVLPDGKIYTPLLNSLGATETSTMYKWGTGPYLDGLFTQGNFGIVSDMTFVLARKPKQIKLVYFKIKTDKQLEYALPSLREAIRLTAGVTGSFNLMNVHRVISMTQKYPDEHIKNSTTLTSQEIQSMAKQGRITAWSGIGAIYGDTHMLRAAKKIIARELGSDVSGLMFVSEWFVRFAYRTTKLLPKFLTGKISSTLLSLLNLFDILHGKPNEVALPLAYWKSGVATPQSPLNPSRDNCGLYWYSPLVPFKEKDILVYIDMVQKICKKHAIEPLITLTTMSDRCFDSTVPIVFNKANEDESLRAKACYYELFTEGQKLGYVPYRYNIQSLHLLKETNSQAIIFASKLKKAIDPNNIIAPGRYVFTNDQ